jgi:excisionase family DNA binding protein
LILLRGTLWGTDDPRVLAELLAALRGRDYRRDGGMPPLISAALGEIATVVRSHRNVQNNATQRKTTPCLEIEDDDATIDVVTASQHLRISRTAVTARIRRGNLPAVKLGGRWHIKAAAVEMEAQHGR